MTMASAFVHRYRQTLIVDILLLRATTSHGDRTPGGTRGGIRHGDAARPDGDGLYAPGPGGAGQRRGGPGARGRGDG